MDRLIDTERSLSSLPLNSGAYILSLDVNEGIKRRLMDFGFTNGNFVIPLYKSPLGDPVAYRVMGGIIALRDEVTDRILVTQRKPERGDFFYDL